jgi:hypothetical protein
MVAAASLLPRINDAPNGCVAFLSELPRRFLMALEAGPRGVRLT